MICEGTSKHVMWGDDWTATTRDGGRSAQFEHTLLITPTGVEPFTARVPSSNRFFWEGADYAPPEPVASAVFATAAKGPAASAGGAPAAASVKGFGGAGGGGKKKKQSFDKKKKGKRK